MSITGKEIADSAKTVADSEKQVTERADSTSEAHATQENAPEVLSEEEQLNLRLKIEERVLRYFQNKEIAKERNEENKLLFEELEELFQTSGDEEVIIALPSGENAVLSPQFREKEVLDKDMLADEMQIAKDELKTPFDFCMFTSQGKLTPAMITKHTTIEREVKLKISKRKHTAKKRKRSAQQPANEMD